MVKPRTTLFLSRQAGRELAIVRNDGLRLWQESYPVGIAQVGQIYRALVQKKPSTVKGVFLDLGSEQAFLPYEFLYHPDPHLNQDALISLLKPGQHVLVQVTRQAERGKHCVVSQQIKFQTPGLILAWPGNRLVFSKKFKGDQKPFEIFKGADLAVIVRRHAAEIPFDCLKQGFESGRLLLKNLESQFEGRIGLINSQENQPAWQAFLKHGHEIDQVFFEGPFEVEKQYWNGIYPQIQWEKHQKGLLRDTYKLETEFQRLLDRKVWLPCGGYLEFKVGSALTVIDVNSGKMKQAHKAERLLKLNLEAADMATRHIQLRGIAGLIVIDFVDLKKETDRQKVTEKVRAGFSRDEMKSRILNMNDFGLLEISRQKGSSHFLQHYVTCQSCKGSGWERSLLSEAYATFDLALRRGVEGEPVRILAPVPLLKFLKGSAGKVILEAIRDQFQSEVHLIEAQKVDIQIGSL